MLNLLNVNPVYLLFSMQIRSYSNESTPFTLFVKDVSIGLILGDATLVRKYPNGNTYLQYAQSIKHSEYLDLVSQYSNLLANDLSSFKPG